MSRSRHRLFTMLAGFALIAMAAAAPAGDDETPAHAPVDVLLQRPVAMADGVTLAATVWKPAGSGADGARVPAVLVVTPYVSDEAHPRARTYVDRGYAMVSVDRRGRGNSGGEQQVFTDVGDDACAVIEWIKAQPWSDGRVAMRGGSYRGMTQWMTARNCPQALFTIIPTASAYPGEDFPLDGPHGAFAYVVRWLALTYGRTANDQLFADEAYWRDKFADAYRSFVPFARLDDFVGAPSSRFQAWVARLDGHAAPFAGTPTAAQYAAMKLPILTITGSYDGDQPGALRYYREHVANATDEAAAEHYLLIGPWDHADTRNPDRELGSSGAVVFGENSVVDMDQLNLDWLDWRLGRGARPALLADRVTYYVGGADEWRHAPSLAAVAPHTRTFYLAADEQQAYEGLRSGGLLDAPVAEQPVHVMRSDPLDVSAADLTEHHRFDLLAGGEIDDPSAAYLPQTLVFHTPVLEAPMTVAGPPRLTLYLSLDAPDADIYVTVAAVLPGGLVRQLGNDVVRARFRSGEPALVEPGVVQPYVFERSRWQAWELPRGARIRLTVGPLNDPSVQKNFNSGGRLGFETREDARVATITLHHDARYPSALELPVAAAKPVGEADAAAPGHRS